MHSVLVSGLSSNESLISPDSHIHPRVKTATNKYSLLIYSDQQVPLLLLHARTVSESVPHQNFLGKVSPLVALMGLTFCACRPFRVLIRTLYKQTWSAAAFYSSISFAFSLLSASFLCLRWWTRRGSSHVLCLKGQNSHQQQQHLAKRSQTGRGVGADTIRRCGSEMGGPRSQGERHWRLRRSL